MDTTPSTPAQAQTQDVVLRVHWTPSQARGIYAINSNGEWTRCDPAVEAARAWRPMASAPSDQPAVCIDIWCADSECRRTDCFWHEGRWCYEVFEDRYRVIPVVAPVAWMPAPGKPEFPAI